MDFDSLIDDSEKQAPLQATPQRPLMFDDLQEDKPLQFDDLKDDSEKPSYIQSLSGPITESPEELVKPGPNQQYAATMGAGQVGGMPGLPLASFGARALKGAIETGLYQGKDEIDKAALGQGDPGAAVAARIAGASLVGGIIGGFTGQRPETISETSKLATETKLGSHISDMLKGIGYAADTSAPIPEDIKSAMMFKSGQGLYKAIQSKSLELGAGALTGHFETGVVGAAINGVIKHMFGDSLSKYSREKIAPFFLKAAASGNIKNPMQIVRHATDITRGDKLMNNGVEALFAKGAQKIADDAMSDSDKDKLRDHIENGGPIEQEAQTSPQPQGFAEGGQVNQQIEPNNEIANHWPEQNTMLNATRSRVYNYLNGIRPVKNLLKLPYDTDHKDPQKERDYDKALTLAAKPLSILNHVKDGSLTPNKLSAFTSMYPELHDELSKRITKRMTEGQVKDETRPPHKVRQAMSLFLGSNLDSSLTPQNMMAAQNVFTQQNNQKSAQVKTTALSKLGKNAQTPDQSREQRLNKS